LEEFKRVMHDELLKKLPPMRDSTSYFESKLPNRPHYLMNPESDVLKEKDRLKLEKINAKYKAAVDKKRREKLFEEIDMARYSMWRISMNIITLSSSYIQIITRERVLLKKERLM